MTLSSGPNLNLLMNGALGEQHYSELMRQWRGFDTLIQLSVKGRVDSLPTVGQVEGDRYILNSTNQVVRWTTFLSSPAWEYYTPRIGWSAYSVADSANYRFNGTAWSAAGEGGAGSTGFANPMNARGDLIMGGDLGAAIRLALGTSGQVLTSNGTNITWANATVFSGGTLASALNEAPIGTIASAAVTNLSTVATNTLTVTGNNDISNLGTLPSGSLRRLIFGGSLTFTHSAGSLILPSSANITTSQGDVAELISLGSGQWRCLAYYRSSGRALVETPAFVGGKLTQALEEASPVPVAAAQTIALPATANSYLITGISSIEQFTGGSVGARKLVRFDVDGGTLVHSENKLSLPGSQNLAWKAGDIVELACLSAANAWVCIGYLRKDGATLAGFSGGTLTSALNEATPVYMTGDFTTNVGPAAANTILINGNTAISSLGTATPGMVRRLIFLGAPTLTNGTNLVLPGNADIAVQANDTAVFVAISTGIWRCVDYQRANGKALVFDPTADQFVGGTLTKAINQAPIGTVIFNTAGDGTIGLTENDTFNTFFLSSNSPGTVDCTGLAAIDSNIPAGSIRTIIFNSNFKFIRGRFYNFPTDGDIIFKEGDTATFVTVASGGGLSWQLISYVKMDGTAIVDATGTGGGPGGSTTLENLSTAYDDGSSISSFPRVSLTVTPPASSTYAEGYLHLFAVGISVGNGNINIPRYPSGVGTINLQYHGGINPETATTLGDYSVLVGGEGNSAQGKNSAIFNGSSCIATNQYSTVFGGSQNESKSEFGVIAGGNYNKTEGTGQNQIIAGGENNTSTGRASAILGGQFNTGRADYGVVLGGQYGTTRIFTGSVVVGGWSAANLPGGSQSTTAVLSAQTTNATPHGLSTTGGNPFPYVDQSATILLAPDGFFLIEARVVAQSSTDRAAWKLEGLVFCSQAGPPEFLGTPTVAQIGATAGAALWAVDLVIIPNDWTVVIKATGVAGVTINWVGKLNTLETVGI